MLNDSAKQHPEMAKCLGELLKTARALILSMHWLLPLMDAILFYVYIPRYHWSWWALHSLSAGKCSMERIFGARLGVLQNPLATIEANCFGNVERCMSAMLEKWLRRPVGEVRDSIQPTWGTLCEALSHIDRPMAKKIAKEHGCKLESNASG